MVLLYNTLLASIGMQLTVKIDYYNMSTLVHFNRGFSSVELLEEAIKCWSLLTFIFYAIFLHLNSFLLQFLINLLNKVKNFEI